MITTSTKPFAVGVALCAALAGCSSTTSGSSSPGATTPPGSNSTQAALPASASATTAAAPTTDAVTTAAPTTAATVVAARQACALITEHDVTAAFGADPGPGSRFASHGATQCQYGSYQTEFLLVNLTPTQGRAGYDMLRKNRRPGGPTTVADITGVGDRAFEVSAHNTAGIFFTKGDALIAVSVTIQRASTPPRASALALAQLAASRM